MIRVHTCIFSSLQYSLTPFLHEAPGPLSASWGADFSGAVKSVVEKLQRGPH